MTAPEPYITGKDFLKALHDAGLLPHWPMLTRVIIDVPTDGVVQMHVQTIAPARLVDLVVDAGPRIEITPA